MKLGRRTGAAILRAGVIAVGAAVVFVAPTAASTRTQVESPRFGGMLCNGVSDDSAALQRLLDSGKATIDLPGGICRIAKPCTLRRDVELAGHATTLLVDFSGVGISGAQVRVIVRDLVIDGGDKASGLISLVGGEFELHNVHLRNVYDRTLAGAKAFVCVDCVRGVVKNSVFESIRALGNGVEGDAAGAARAIYLSGMPQAVHITESRFATVHSVDASGTPVMEDADAIHVAAIGRDVHVQVDRNLFVDVGKRAVKFQCNGAVASRNVVRSGWRDGRKMMFAAVQLAGSRLAATGNSIGGGPLQHGIELSDAEALPNGAPAVANLVASNTIDGAGVGDAGPYGLRSGIVAELQNDLTVVGNSVLGFRNGVLVRGGSRVSLLANQAEDVGYCFASEPPVRGVAATTRGLLIADNRCVGRSPTGRGVGAYVSTGTGAVAIAGNLFRAFTDGVDIRGRAGVCALSRNAFNGVARHQIRDEARRCVTVEQQDAAVGPVCDGSSVGLMWRFDDGADAFDGVRVCATDGRGAPAWKSLAVIRPIAPVPASSRP